MESLGVGGVQQFATRSQLHGEEEAPFPSTTLERHDTSVRKSSLRCYTGRKYVQPTELGRIATINGVPESKRYLSVRLDLCVDEESNILRSAVFCPLRNFSDLMYFKPFVNTV